MSIEKSGKTILLVEDEIIISMNEASLLGKYGYEVITAVNAKEAIETVQGNIIDLILMDIDLGQGEMDGTEAAQIILKEHDIPVVFLSSHIDLETVEKTEKITSYGYVVKSSSMTVLDASIKMAFKLFEAHIELNKRNMLIQAGNENLRVTVEELETSRNRLTSIFRAAPTGIGVVIDRNLVEINYRICEMTGYQEDELVGKPARVLYPTQEDFDFVGREKYAQIKLKGTGAVETRWKCRDGKIIDVLLSSTPMDVNDLAKGVTFTALDITERKQVKKELQLSKERFEQVAESAEEWIWEIDSEGLYTYSSSVVEKLLGYKPDEIVGKMHFYDLFHPDIKEEIKDLAFKDFAMKQSITKIRNANLHKNGQTVILQASGVPVLDKEGNLTGYRGIDEDVTEHMQIVEQLRESEERLRLITDNINEVFWVVSPDWTKVHYVNPAYEKVWGKTVKSLYDNPLSWLDSLVNEDRKKTMEYIEEKSNGDLSEINFPEYRVQLEDESINWIKADGFSIKNDKGEITSIVGIAINITDIKKAQIEIKNLLQEKETLLKEVHHRIKNDISIIESLLRMHSESLEIPEAVTAIQDAIVRIKSMGVLYDKIYRTESYRDISITDYFSKLIDEIFQLFPDNRNIELEKQFNDFTLSIKNITPLGIIINELMTNAMKYAFTGRKNGLIKISAENKDNHVKFILEDNGIGIPQKESEKKHKGFGLTLIDLLVKQIGGSYIIERDNGTKFIIEFDI